MVCKAQLSVENIFVAIETSRWLTFSVFCCEMVEPSLVPRLHLHFSCSHKSNKLREAWG